MRFSSIRLVGVSSLTAALLVGCGSNTDPDPTLCHQEFTEYVTQLINDSPQLEDFPKLTKEDVFKNTKHCEGLSSDDLNSIRTLVIADVMPLVWGRAMGEAFSSPSEIRGR